jgi:hypothetical protein
MDNDKKTTILGVLKAILVGVASIFFANQPNTDAVVQTIIGAVGAIWAVVEVVNGILTNKK